LEFPWQAITVNLAQEVVMRKVVATAKRVGITSPLEANASLALGTNEVTPIELTSAYAAFANGGYRTYPYMVTEVDIGGKAVYLRHAPQPERVIASSVDRDLTAMLYGVITHGTGGYASLHGREAAGKTGTTQDSHDAWFQPLAPLEVDLPQTTRQNLPVIVTRYGDRQRKTFASERRVPGCPNVV